MPDTAKTYLINEVNNAEQPFELKATRAEYDSQSGRTLFYNGEELVGNYINVTYRVKA